MLPFGIYNKMIDDIKNAGWYIKQISFSGLGEPLLHSDLAKMISLAKSVSNDVVIVTNGSLLSPENIDKLIACGVDKFKISLEGLCADTYKEICGTQLDFDKFVSNITYLFSNRKNCKIFIKILDVCIINDTDISKFHKIFQDIADGLTIEHMVPFRKQVNYSFDSKDFKKSVHGFELTERKYRCSQPFFGLLVMHNGDVVPCQMIEDDALVIGNIEIDNISKLWNCEKINTLRIKHLKEQQDSINNCKNCLFPKYWVDDEYSNLDSVLDSLIIKYQENFKFESPNCKEHKNEI
jgi:radical SAM protein with 4Fe4S-binding SPASM domain